MAKRNFPEIIREAARSLPLSSLFIEDDSANTV
jgi:hypothetical protein